MNTDQARREMIRAGQPALDLLVDDGPKWDTLALHADFEVLGFGAPFAVVRRRSDGARGTLEFTDNPRVYFDFQVYTPGLLSRDDAVMQPTVADSFRRPGWKRVWRPVDGHEITEEEINPTDLSKPSQMVCSCSCGWRWDGKGRMVARAQHHCGAPESDR